MEVLEFMMLRITEEPMSFHNFFNSLLIKSNVEYTTFNDGKDYVIEIMLPGVEKERLAITKESNKIRVKCQKRQDENQRGYYRDLEFNNVFELPFIPAKVGSKLESGVLSIRTTPNEDDSNIIEIE